MIREKDMSQGLVIIFSQEKLRGRCLTRFFIRNVRFLYIGKQQKPFNATIMTLKLLAFYGRTSGDRNTQKLEIFGAKC